MGFISAILEFFGNLFGGNTEQGRRRKALKPIVSSLQSMHPQFYRDRPRAAMPGFAQTLLAFCRALAPIRDIAARTIANGDQKVSRRYLDLIVELHLTQEERERKRSFTYEGMSARVSESLEPDREMKAVEDDFRDFLVTIGSGALRPAEEDLEAMDRLAEICRHDYERLLGLFDPGINLENPKYKPDFKPSASDQIAPELIDVHYVLRGFAFTDRVWAGIVFLLERLAPGGDRDEQKKRLNRVVSALNALVSGPLHPDNVLALVRALKQDPSYAPSVPRERRNHLEEFRRRIENQFEKDRERVMRERHESAMTQSVKDLYGDEEIMTLNGYNDETNAHLQAESSHSFTMVQPLRLVKTFVFGKFEPIHKGPVKRLLVEGYFDNKAFQNNLANVFYQCERSAERIQAFEDTVTAGGRQTVAMARRFIEESKRGKDVSQFLPKLVDSLNLRAKELVENEVNLFNLLAESFYEIITDFKKSAPELVTNIRTIGVQRNREIINGVTNAYNDIQKLVKVIRCFPMVHVGLPSGPRADAPKPERQGPIEPPKD